MSGGLRDCLVLSFVSVSPCRTANLISRLLHHHCKRPSKSRFKARRGVTYRTLIPGRVRASGSWMSMFRMGSIADSVLPVAVGEINKTFFPSRIFGIVSFCGLVGVWNPLCSTSLRMGFTKRLKTFSESLLKKVPELQTWEK